MLVFCIYPGVCRFVTAGSPLEIRFLLATVGIPASVEDLYIICLRLSHFQCSVWGGCRAAALLLRRV